VSRGAGINIGSGIGMGIGRLCRHPRQSRAWGLGRHCADAPGGTGRLTAMPVSRPSPDLQRARIAFGVAAICGLFLLETAVAHRTAPRAASVWVWSALGAMALAALGCGLRWGLRHRRRAFDR
jgi:hypothetical protein